MKTLFWGIDRPDSLAALRYLAGRTEVVRCICGGGEADGEMMLFCKKNQISVVSQKELTQELSSGALGSVDMGFCFCYHFLIPKESFSYPREGTINFHPAPLPEHRGLGGSSYAILHGCDEWGVTAHYMDDQYDEGPIIEVERFSIHGFCGTAYELTQIIQNKNGELFRKMVDRVSRGIVPEGTRLPPTGHYYGKKELEKDKQISPKVSAEELDRQIRAFWYPPYSGAGLEIDGTFYTLVNQEILEEIAALYRGKNQREG